VKEGQGRGLGKWPMPTRRDVEVHGPDVPGAKATSWTSVFAGSMELAGIRPMYV
jgi:hypothetical protein